MRTRSALRRRGSMRIAGNWTCSIGPPPQRVPRICFARLTAVACLIALATVLALRTGPAFASTSYIDGVSDQSLASWEPEFSSLFAKAWVGSPPSHIKLARYVVQWNVMGGGGYPNELNNFTNWYTRAGELKLTREVALADYVGAKEPTQSSYQTELTSLLSKFTGITSVEAWNEPNHQSSRVNFYATPTRAAEYMNSAYSVCGTHACTAIAGDFLDEANMAKYEKEYKAKLSPADPGNWGIHPYSSVESHSKTRMEEFRAGLPAGKTDRIWFTEVGAYYCRPGETKPRGEAAQASDATYLAEAFIPNILNLEHAFYYEFALGNDGTVNCADKEPEKETEDTELYAPSGGSSDKARSAAQIIFGPQGKPGVHEVFASEVTSTRATLSGKVRSQSLQGIEYYFEYRPTTESTWSTTAKTLLPEPSLNWTNVNATIVGLAPETGYVYRLCDANDIGTTCEEGTFATSPPELGLVAVNKASEFELSAGWWGLSGAEYLGKAEGRVVTSGGEPTKYTYTWQEFGWAGGAPELGEIASNKQKEERNELEVVVQWWTWNGTEYVHQPGNGGTVVMERPEPTVYRYAWQLLGSTGGAPEVGEVAVNKKKESEGVFEIFAAWWTWNGSGEYVSKGGGAVPTERPNLSEYKYTWQLFGSPGGAAEVGEVASNKEKEEKSTTELEVFAGWWTWNGKEYVHQRSNGGPVVTERPDPAVYKYTWDMFGASGQAPEIGEVASNKEKEEKSKTELEVFAGWWTWNGTSEFAHKGGGRVVTQRPDPEVDRYLWQPL